MDSQAHIGVETRTCALCGVPKSLDHFDPRFVHKGTRVTCAECRGVRDAKSRAAWEKERAEREAEEALTPSMARAPEMPTSDAQTTRRLTIELVPSPCWYISLKNLLPQSDWDVLRRSVYRHYGYRCGICGAAGRMNAHELWRYDDTTHAQRLEGIMAVCDMCHHVKHLGHAGILAGEGKLDFDEVIAHYCAVNECTRATFDVDEHIAFGLWARRSAHDWTTDFGDYAELLPAGEGAGSSTAPPLAPQGETTMSTPTRFYGDFERKTLAEIALWARGALARPSLRILDSETTGHGGRWDNERDEIVELCLIDPEGTPLLNTLVRPDGRMHPDAAAKSGITDDLLAEASPFSALASQIAEQLEGKDIVIYNAEYDDRLLRAAFEACGQTPPPFEARCAMQAYAAFRHIPDARRPGYKWHRLDDACAHEGIAVAQAHRALGDCLATLGLLRRMAEGAPTGRPPYVRST